MAKLNWQEQVNTTNYDVITAPSFEHGYKLRWDNTSYIKS